MKTAISHQATRASTIAISHLEREEIDEKAREMADALLDMEAGERELAALSGKGALERTAVRFARSRAAILASRPFRLSIVSIASKENRLLEDSRHLSWLFRRSDSSYQTFVVDDMSKDGHVRQGRRAEETIYRNALNRFHVLYLEDGIKREKSKGTLASHALRGTDLLARGSKEIAYKYGAAKAMEGYEGHLPHLIAFTDISTFFHCPDAEEGAVGEISLALRESGISASVFESRSLREHISVLDSPDPFRPKRGNITYKRLTQKT
jgi:hypothetical protein